jgi:molecular chaperone DnaK
MRIIGIDLGTTFSAIGVVTDGQPEIIPVEGHTTLPSVVGLTPQDKWLVGQTALNQWILHPERTIRSIKRKMGTDEQQLLSGDSYSPQQISAIILRTLKQAAADHLGEPVEQAVITVPAYFSEVQRRATIEAGEIAGLKVARIVNEPTAAALAYGMDADTDAVALVYDLGGGTFDVSLVEMSGGVVDVRASHGNTHLGGDDFDERLAKWLVQRFEDQHGVDLRNNRQAQARLRRAAEGAKIALSSEPFTWVREEYLAEKDGAALHLEIEISRQQFIDLIDDLLHETLDSVERVLKDGGVEQPDQVLLVGGSTYIPAVRELIADYTGVTPRVDVDPSEVVALGAGIQGAIIAGEPIDVILVDVTPFSLGIAIAEQTVLGQMVPDRYKVLIPRNSTIPISQKEVFYAMHPSQKTVRIEVYQGENRIASENDALGEFLFDRLSAPSPGDVPQITVQFDLDVNGILNVQATDRTSGRETGITVNAAHHRLSQQEIKSAYETLPMISATGMISEDLIREAEVLLARAQRLDSEALGEEIAEVEQALDMSDEDWLRDALESLSDALFDLEDDQ